MGKSTTIIVIVVIVLIAAGAAWYFLRPEPEDTTAVTSPEPTAYEEVQEEVEAIEVELSKSDELVRGLVLELSSRPEVARWLLTDNLIRRFVATVDLIANGGSPKNPIDFIELRGNFQASREDGTEFINPKSYQRYERLTGIIDSLDAEGFVTLYKQLRLPIQEAYRDLGYPEEDFNATFKTAMMSLLETPIVEDKIFLDKDVLTYTMRDPELEKLTPAQKHLLRMGPDNMRTVQAKLRDIARTLGFLY